MRKIILGVSITHNHKWKRLKRPTAARQEMRVQQVPATYGMRPRMNVERVK